MAQPQILVVEDNPVIAGMIRRFLTKSNYGITGIVTTGEEAVELAGQSMPSLALMDVQLAGKMDGITAARLIGEKFQIPTIYLTGSSDAETIARAASTEAYGYLLKPVQERELIKTVELALSKHESECRARFCASRPIKGGIVAPRCRKASCGTCFRRLSRLHHRLDRQ